MLGFALLGLGLIGLILPPADDTPDAEQAGADGNDVLTGGDGSDSQIAGNGDDLIVGAAGDDLQQGGDGRDVLIGQSGADTLEGGAGDDLLVAGTGIDLLAGGAGNDELITVDIVDDAALAEALRAAPDRVDVSFRFEFAADTAEQDQADGGAGDDLMFFGGADSVTGGDGADRFLGGDWIEPGHAALITDFDPQEDLLIYSHDGPAPNVAIAPDSDGHATLLVDGALVVRFGMLAAEDLSESDIILRQRAA